MDKNMELTKILFNPKKISMSLSTFLNPLFYIATDLVVPIVLRLYG